MRKMHLSSWQSHTSLLLLFAVTGALSGCTPIGGDQATPDIGSRPAGTTATVVTQTAVTVSSRLQVPVSTNAPTETVSSALDETAPGQAVGSKGTSATDQPGRKTILATSQADSVEIAQQNQDPTPLPEIITGMEVGMPYAEARALIDPNIWAARTYPPLDYVSMSVQAMRDLGYEEVRDCAGSGLGLCRMEFIEREGLVLVIVVTTSEAEPMVWTWDVE
ncbi:MAG: hypothetical protein AAF282_15185 [Cyanobacteria bacterium P01_A01_bin.15]